ncbi:hypothetical protein MasN3_48100 [Massilia varians]|uniref:Transposase n=1 Tax=Massilia varians TaxID=457921 RepID=A0ABN6TLR6_9BURK|nr:hypothetical protein MasN3_48100 [Massilia varians]
MAAVFLDGLIPWPKHFAQKTFGCLKPLISRPVVKGGRPRINDQATLTGILFVLKTGIPREYLPRELGCGSA